MKKYVLVLIALMVALSACAPSNNSPSDFDTPVLEETGETQNNDETKNTESDVSNTNICKETKLLFNKAYDGFYYSEANFIDIDEFSISVSLPEECKVVSNPYYGPETVGEVKTHNIHTNFIIPLQDSEEVSLLEICGLIKVSDLESFDYSVIENDFPKNNGEAPYVQPNIKKTVLNDRHECIIVESMGITTYYIRVSDEYVIEMKSDVQGYADVIDSSVITQIVNSVSVQ